MYYNYAEQLYLKNNKLLFLILIEFLKLCLPPLRYIKVISFPLESVVAVDRQ